MSLRHMTFLPFACTVPIQTRYWYSGGFMMLLVRRLAEALGGSALH